MNQYVRTKSKKVHQRLGDSGASCKLNGTLPRTRLLGIFDTSCFRLLDSMIVLMIMKSAPQLMLLSMTVSDIITFGISIAFTGLTSAVGIPWVGYSWDDMHGFVVPYVLATALATLLAIMAIAFKGRRTSLGFYAAIVNWTLPLFCWYAISRWPGGDDGGGMAWKFFVIPLTLLTFIISVLFCCTSKRVEITTKP